MRRAWRHLGRLSRHEGRTATVVAAQGQCPASARPPCCAPDPHQHRPLSGFGGARRPVDARAAAVAQPAGAWLQRRGIFIQTQSTPNPASLMFLPGSTVMESGTMEFQSGRASMGSPLAKKLFAIDGVKSLFFGSDFITVTKAEGASWGVLKPDVFAAISDHLASGEAIVTDPAQADPATTILPDDNEVVAMIKELLETRIRPAVQDDGGDVLFQEFDEESGVVKLKMAGACSGCPSSSLTLKSGIENMMKHYIPEVKSVVQAEPDEAEEEGLREFRRLDAQLST